MKATFIALVGLVLVLTASCFLGDRFGTGKAVSVRFLPPAGQTAVSLSADGPEVKEVLTITDAVLNPEGLARDPGRGLRNPNGLIAYYYHTPQKPSSCEVFLDGDRVNIVFLERYERHPSPQVKGMCSSLAKRLKARFGDDKISVQ